MEPINTNPAMETLYRIWRATPAGQQFANDFESSEWVNWLADFGGDAPWAKLAAIPPGENALEALDLLTTEWKRQNSEAGDLTETFQMWLSVQACDWLEMLAEEADPTTNE